MKFTVGRKLAVSFGIVLFIMVLSGFIVMTQLGSIKTNLNEIVNVASPTSGAAYEMEINLIGTGFGLLGYLEDRDPEHLDRIKGDIKDFQEYQKIYNDLSTTIKSKELSVQINDMFDRYIKLAYIIINLEDEQDQKVIKLFSNHSRMDDILDDKIQAVVISDKSGSRDKLVAVMELEINVNGIAKGLGEYLRTHDSRYEARVMKDESDFKHFWKQYKSSDLTRDEIKWAEELGDLFKESVGLTGEIIEINKRIGQNRSEFVKVRRKMDEILDEGIQEIALQKLEQADKAAVGSIKATSNIALFLLIFGVMLGAGAAFFISRYVTESIRRLSASAKEISKGDLTTRVEIKSHDEIGELADTFNEMAEELSVVKSELESRKDILEKQVGERTKELEESKISLEKSVQERTEELEESKLGLEEKILELENFYDAAVDRELKMEEMRKRIKELEE
jgi:HAMP domain-containing protein